MGKKTLVLLSGAAMLILVAVVRLADPMPVQQVRLVYFDYLQRLIPRAAADLPVRVLASSIHRNILRPSDSGCCT